MIPPRLQPQVLQLLHMGHFAKAPAPSTATSPYGTFRDTVNEVTGTHCSLLARDGCRDHGPLPSMYCFVLSTRKSHPSLQTTPGCLQRSHGVMCMLTMQSIFWVAIGLSSSMPTPNIHSSNSTSTKSTTELLEQDLEHFSYPHTIVMDIQAHSSHRGSLPSRHQWCS